jgi:hypothetical protein
LASYLDVCRFTAASSGTGSFVVSAAVTGYQTPASAGAVNTAVYRYRAESTDLSQWEVGYGVYTTADVTLTRATILFNSSGGASAINFTAAPQVAVTLLAEDLVFIHPPQGRLTLQTGTPVMNSTQSAKTTIYYTPHAGNQVPIYDGVSFRNIAFAELSVATTDTTKSPAAIGASKVNDWFVWDDAGTTRVGHGPDWTNDTTRGYSLSLTNGIYLNASSITNGPAALRGTWVGTTRSNASSQLDFIVGGSSSGGTAAFIYIWNSYNRVPFEAISQNSKTSWNNTTAAWASADASTTFRINFVRGLDAESVTAKYAALALTTTNAVQLGLGIGLNATNALATGATGYSTSATTYFNTVNNNQIASVAHYAGLPGVGVHYLQAIEYGGTGGAFVGVNGITSGGLFASLWY